MDSIDVMNEVETITEEAATELAKEQADEKLIPKGKWEGLVIYSDRVEEDAKSPNSTWRGLPQWKVGVKFFDCPEIGKSKTQFFSMTHQKVLNENNRPKSAYTSLVGMCKALGMLGQPIKDVLEQAKVTRLVYNVDVTKADDDGRQNNYLRGIGAA